MLWRPETKLDLLDSFVLQSWALIDPSVYPVNGLSQLLHPGLFFHLLSPFPQVISFDAFSPSKSTIGHVAVNDGCFSSVKNAVGNLIGIALNL